VTFVLIAPFKYYSTTATTTASWPGYSGKIW